MQLFADRFVVTGEKDGAHRAIDLATGGLVTVLTSTAGGASDQKRWSMRCDQFFRVRHRCIARLVDYGSIGPVARFEAWRCGECWRGSSHVAAATLARAEMFLHATGASDGDISLVDLRTDGGRPVLLPRPATGYEREQPTCASIDDPALCGVTTIDRPSLGAVIEILATANGPAPVAITLGAIDGAGGSVATHQLARVARMLGFVPLSNVVPFDGLDALDGRTLCLIDHRGGNAAWPQLLDRLLVASRPHVLISIGPNILHGTRRLHLERIPTEALIQSVTPRVESAALRKIIERAATKAEGLPARFAERLWGPGIQSQAARRPRAAETPPTYGVEAARAVVAAAPARIWPATPDVAACRKRLADALVLLQQGRHAPAERSLRAAIGSLARRHDWHHAARGQVALAGALLSRGRAQTARETLDDARVFAMRAGKEAPLLDIAVLAGHARLDQGRLDDAETMLRGSMAAARASGAVPAIADASAALARCLFWRGRFGEADAVLDAASPHDAASAVRFEVLRSRVALGRGDIGAAMSHASSARDCAERHCDPLTNARALHALAFAHLVAGDVRSVEHDVDLCVKAARKAHDPLRALKARILDAEARRRTNGGSTEQTRHLLERTARMDLPITIRSRLALLADLSRGVDEAVRKQVAGTGLHALALFAPADAQQRALGAYDAAIDILTLCQAGDDDRAVVAEVCRRVRERLGAAGVAIYIRDGQPLVPLVVEGNGVEPAIAGRAIDARQSIPPRQYHERIEGAAPIRYAGDTIGALAVRWTIANPPDPPRADMLLTMTATAAATAVMGAMARRRAAAAPGLAEILGISRPIADVREAVERAAAAPFPVLVEGESGSGKELIARALHRRSSRRDRPFCALNCAALPDDLVDAELFGHSRGAFTGALADRQGVFEEAHLGTLFLDEIGELSPRAQAKVLRTLQDGDLRRVGESTSRRVDVRVVAATNRDLRQEVSAGRFRLDLLYRLDVVRITVPPLRDRRDDIPLLAEHFWHAAAERVGSRAVLSAQTIAVLTRHDWPGNVRELQNVLASLAVRAAKRGFVPPTALPPAFATAAVPSSWRLGEARRSFEERFIRSALARSGGHRGRAADELGLSRQGLAKLMTRLRIS